MVLRPLTRLINSDAARAASCERGSPSPSRRGVRERQGRLLAVLVLAASAVLVGGCGQPSPHTHEPYEEVAPFDLQFIDMMTPHHEGAVLMATTAQDRAEHAELNAMADAMIAAQNEEISQMKAWRQAWYGSDQTPPVDEMPMLPGLEHDSMMMDMVQMNEELKTANPFDKAFIDAMIPHHQMAIDAAEMAQQKAERPEIRALAATILDDQQAEIDQMKAWRAAWYPGQ